MREDLPVAVPAVTAAPAQPAQSGGPGDGQLHIVAEPRWDVYYAVVFAAVAAIVEVGPISATGRIIAGAALAAMVPWYVFVGRPLMFSDEADWRTGTSRRAMVYLAVLVVLFAVVQSQNLDAWFLAFALSPQCFHVASPRAGMVFVVVFNVTAGALEAWRNRSLAGMLIALGIVIFTVTFSYAFSRWTIRVIEQSLERAELISQLESTRAELAAAHHEAGVLAERHRLAGEIHDTLAQGFTSIVTLLQAAGASLPPAANTARHHVDLALATARENLAEARTLVAALSPAPLEQGSLAEAVRRVADATGAEAGVQARSEVTGTARRLPMGAEVVLLRVCQETLANVRKHASAHEAVVRLAYADDVVRLTISDDGAGFDPELITGGYGLRGMRDRVAQVGGTIQVTSAPGSGTQVCAEVPG
ncbi:MAG: sensor histidine kinase [Streptosporangiaceae bacterium]